jgi:hypothetical protein
MTVATRMLGSPMSKYSLAACGYSTSLYRHCDGADALTENSLSASPSLPAGLAQAASGAAAAAWEGPSHLF